MPIIEREPKVIPDAQIVNLRDDLILGAAIIYHNEWGKLGLSSSPDEAKAKMRSFNHNFSYAVVDGAGVVYAVLNTLPIAISGLEEAVEILPTYKQVEELAKKNDPPGFPTHLICFSIVADTSFKYRAADPFGEGDLSLPAYLLKTIASKTTARIMPYSRFSDVPASMDPLEFYRRNINNLKTLGAVGMHMHLGNALPVAILRGARSEDANGGYANVLLIYPRNAVESAMFSSINENRRTGVFTYRDIGNAVVFSDIP